mgnify:CR=1 FL=1
MACACKETAKKAGELSEDSTVFEEISGWKKVLFIIERFIISVLSFVIIVAISPIMLFIMIFRGLLGTKNTIKVSKMVNLLKKAQK